MTSTTPKVLMLANSEIGRRRVLPALRSAGVRKIDVASRRAAAEVRLPEGCVGRTFEDYGAALDSSDAELVWISTVNSLHAELAEAAMSAGRHVIIDKPATTTPEDSDRIIAMARRHDRVLAEATVYPFHPQIGAARSVFDRAGSCITQIVAEFSFPPLPPENFRHRPDLGGGALLDLGPYAVSLGRVFLDAAPERVDCQALPGDVGLSVILGYPGGRTVTGHFGGTTGYVNRLSLLGPAVTVAFDRAFTTPPDRPFSLSSTVDNRTVITEGPAADTFQLFAQSVFDAIDDGRPEPFLDAMAEDARNLGEVRRSSERPQTVLRPPSSRW